MLMDFNSKLQYQEFHLTIPEENFKELRIVLIPQTLEKSTDRVKILGKFGTERFPTSRENDFESIHLWNGGQGVFLNKAQLSSNRKLSLVVEA